MDLDLSRVSTNPAAFMAATSVLNMPADIAVSTISGKISPPLQLDFKNPQ